LGLSGDYFEERNQLVFPVRSKTPTLISLDHCWA
jgi:hypothetical protein